MSDAFMIWTSGAALGTALTGVRDTGLDSLPIFAASSAMVWSQITGLSTVLPKTIYFVGFGFDSDKGRNDVSTRKLKAFDDAVTSAGMHIDGVTGLSWDGVAIVVDALRTLGPDATAEQLRAWIAAQKNYPGISGLYKQAWLPASKFGGTPL
jgi:hypothetical protein